MVLETNACESSMFKVGFTKSKLSPTIDYINLSGNWCISPYKANITVQRMTQQGICTVLH